MTLGVDILPIINMGPFRLAKYHCHTEKTLLFLCMKILILRVSFYKNCILRHENFVNFFHFVLFFCLKPYFSQHFNSLYFYLETKKAVWRDCFV